MTAAPVVMVVLFVIVACVVGWISISVLRLGVLNPISIYMGVWTVIVGAYGLPFLDLRPLTITVLGYASIAAAAFTVGALVGLSIIRRRRGNGDLEPSLTAYSERRLVIAQTIAITALAANCGLQIWRVLPALQAAGGLTAILGGSGIDVRRAYLADAIASAQTSLNGASAAVAVVGYVLFIGTISLFWGGYFLRRRRYGLAFAPLVIVALESLLLLQRADFVYALLLFTFGWRYHAAARLPTAGLASASRRFRAGVLLTVVTVAVLIVPVSLRQSGAGSTGPLQSLMDYPFSGIAGLSALSVDDPTLTSAASPLTSLTFQTSAGTPTPLGPTPTPTEGDGAWSFFGLASVLTRLGVPVGVPANYFAYEPIQLHGSAVSNVYTYLIYGYYDFGGLGFVLIPAALGLFAAPLDQLARRRWSFIPWASILMTTVAMTFFGLSLPRDLRYVMLIVLSPALFALVRSRPVSDRKALRRHQRPLARERAETVISRRR